MPGSGLGFAPVISRPFISKPDGSMDQWLAAKATGNATVLALGDSVLQGNNATSRITGSYWGLIRTWLTGAGSGTPTNTPYTHGGDFWTCAASVAGDSAFGTPVPWVVNGTPVWTPNGYGRVPIWSSAPGSPIMVFSSLYACTDIDIVYQDNGTGTIGYHVDAEASGTRTITLHNTNQQAKVQITGLSNATHTVTFDTQSAGNVMAIMGISTYPTNANRTTGIHFAWMAHGGQELSTFGPLSPGGLSFGLYDPMAAFAGRYAGVVTGVTNASPPVVTITPVLGPTPAIGTQVSFVGIVGSIALNLPSTSTIPPNPIYKISAVSGNNYTLQNLDGTNPTAPGAYTSGGIAWFHSGFGFPVNPDLIIMELTGAADCLNLRGLEGFEECYRRLFGAFSRGRPSAMPSVVATLTSLEAMQTPDNPFLFPNSKIYHKYAYRAKNAYDSYVFAFFNMQAWLGQSQVISGYINPGDVHPNNTGHTAIAAYYKAIL